MEEAQEEQPFYVNAKQYHRISKRRIARARLDETLKSAPGRKPYLHESRHKHAMRRPRGQGGRFLTAAEIAEMAAKEKQQQTAAAGNSDQASNSTSGNESGAGIESPTTSTSESITDATDSTASKTDSKQASQPGSHKTTGAAEKGSDKTAESQANAAETDETTNRGVLAN